MKLPFNSIRWRLQVWHGMILCAVLTAFGAFLHSVAREITARVSEQELRRRATIIAETTLSPQLREAFRGLFLESLREPLVNKNHPHRPDPFPKAPLVAEGRPTTSPDDDFYYAVWSREKVLLDQSANVPALLPPPEKEVPGGAYLRDRGGVHELALITPGGDRLLVGRSIGDHTLRLKDLAWRLAVMGGIILLGGLAGGWWMGKRALEPLNHIGATANKIAHGNLSERINVSNTETELGQLAEVLNNTFARLQAAFDRQAQFTADASHELRTPVAVILTQAQSALSRERPAHQYRDALAACQRAALRMGRLIESLLMLARLDTQKPDKFGEVCDLEIITRDAVELLQPLASTHNIQLEITTESARCQGEPGQLGQVVTNLVGNAIAYTPPGGQVRVRVQATGAFVELSVTDTGMGIPAADLPHIFERFYRVDKARSQPGTHSGLGLAITQAIVTVHGGQIVATSTVGEGSQFLVKLPAASPAPVAA